MVQVWGRGAVRLGDRTFICWSPLRDQILGGVRQGFGGPRVQVPQCGQDILCTWLNHGMTGFSPEVTDVAENTHHYAGQLLAGYYMWGWIANTMTWAREVGQGISVSSHPYVDSTIPFSGLIVTYNTDQLDVNMGEIATRHARGLRQGKISISGLPDLIRRDLAP